jgi:hypothetical protein
MHAPFSLTLHRGDTHIGTVHVRTRGMAALAAGMLLFSAHGLPAHADAAAPGAAFLGMAVASGISQGKDGLTVLKGVHNAIWSDTMPVTQDLQLYTRWAGTGTHTIGVNIIDKSTGKTIAQSSDDLDFGQDPVTYYAHDFSGTKFPSDGAYGIEVTLDGAASANYAFYVNVDDKLPDYPAYVLSVPAEGGGLDDTGDATVSGIFEYFTFQSFPATDSFKIVTVWFSGDGDFDHFVRILDPSGKQLTESRHSSLSAYYGEMSVATDAFESVAFPSPGIYTAVVSLDGDKVFSFPLVIAKH